MPELKELVAFVEGIAPAELAEEWDNPGLLVDAGGNVDAVLVTLDITAAVVAEAQNRKCQLILAHHPVIFQPLTQLAHEDVVYRLVQSGVSALCAHTNLDAADGGVNDVLAGLMELKQLCPFGGFGRLGTLADAPLPTVLAARCAEKLQAHVQFADAGRPVKRLAVVGGSGKGMVRQAAEAGADALLTGEAGHHDALDALQAGISLFAAGHFATEWPVVPVLAQKLQAAFPGVRVHTSAAAQNPFCTVTP